MRCIGVAERALEMMCQRVKSRVAFGKPLAEQGTLRADIAQSRMEIEQARLLTLKAAYMMDTVGNKEARAEMALASLFGGMALANAGLGAVHGFAGPIGGMFSAPHGEICAALLPHAMRINLRALRERESQSYAIKRYYRVARILTGNDHATADAGIEWVHELVNDFNIPRLGNHGIKPEHSAEIVKNAMNASSMKANPIKLTEAELGEILQSAI